MLAATSTSVEPESFEITVTWKSWAVVLAASLFFFYEFIQMNMFNAISPALLSEFHVSAARLGAISANYFYANILFLFPAGMILDRFSVKKILLAAMSLAIIGTVAFSFATTVWFMDLARFVTGVGSVFNLLSCVKLASRWFPPRKMAFVVGAVVTMAMLGGMLAQTPLTLLTDYLSWRAMLRIDGGFGLFLISLIAIFVCDFPKHHHEKISSHKNYLKELSFKKTVSLTIKNSQNWLGGLYTSFMNLPIFLLGAMWGGLYLIQVHNLSRTDASFVTSMIFIGTIVGSPVLGFISDHIGLRKKPMLVCSVIALALMLTLVYVPNLNLYQLLALFFAIGFFTSAQIISYPLVTESNHPALTGSSVGLAAALIMSGGLTQPIFGYLMGLNWDHKYVNGVPFYSVHDYRLALMIMVVAFVLSFFMAILVKETHCKMCSQEKLSV